MPQTIKAIKERYTVQTNKLNGYEILRKCKASALYASNTYINVAHKDLIFYQFKHVLGANHKGDTNFFPAELEDFNSFRVRTSGKVFLDGAEFGLSLVICSSSYNILHEIPFNYNQGHNLSNNGVYIDWDFDVEVTYFLNDNNEYVFIVNGYYLHSNDHHNECVHVSKVPVCGEFATTVTKLLLDVKVYNGSETVSVKDFSVDFIE
jgi:hypothetical protein